MHDQRQSLIWRFGLAEAQPAKQIRMWSYALSSISTLLTFQAWTAAGKVLSVLDNENVTLKARV